MVYILTQRKGSVINVMKMITYCIGIKVEIEEILTLLNIANILKNLE